MTAVVGADPAAMTSVACDKLVVFLSRGMSFERWHRAGILDREMSLYRQLMTGSVGRLTFVTYGGPEDAHWASVFPGVEILPNKWGLAANLYSLIAPWLHRRQIGDASLFKTNQLNGAWTALVAKRLFRKPLLVRCGFLWADFTERLTPSRWRRSMARFLERLVLRNADRVIVAAEADAARIAECYGVDRSRVSVIPNYVDTAVFRPSSTTSRYPRRIVFVGRLEPQKNLDALIDAVAPIAGVSLQVIGEGSLRTVLEERAHAQGLTVEFHGRLSQADLPALLAGADLFVLPSHYEGNPKALVEAMACGVPVIGTRVPGIQEVVVDGETGVLCGTSAADIRHAIDRLLTDGTLRDRLREGGLRYVHQTCSLELAAARERALLAEMCRMRSAPGLVGSSA